MIRDKKKLPKALVEKQELQRQETINKVLRACADIENESKGVTIAALTKYTGLSRSTLAKPHIRELLVARGYGSDYYAVEASKRKKVRQCEIIVEKDKLIAQLTAKNKELEKECEFLRGKFFIVSNLMRNKT